jgi:hypothetical protein
MSERIKNGRWWLVCAMLGVAAGCAYPGPAPDALQAYGQALADTDPQVVRLVAPGSEAEARGLAQFIELFSEFDPEKMTGGLSQLYADESYFRDTFVELHSAQEIERYFVDSARAVDHCSFDIQDVAVADGNYYLRWTMDLRLKRHRDKPIQTSVGMSHVRFNEEGRIIFHQDYWDAGLLYEQFPVMGSLIRYARRRLENP